MPPTNITNLSTEEKKRFQTTLDTGLAPQDAIKSVNTITSDSLSDSTTPINIPAVAPSTIADRISGRSQALLEFDAQEQKARAEKEQKETELRSSQGVTQSLLEKIGLTRKTEIEKGREEFGLDVLETTRKEALKNLRTSQVQELAEIKALETANMTDGGRFSAISEIKRRNGLDQLTSQLSYNLANSDITAAEETINDRIALVTEPLYTQLDLQKNVYEQISDSLDEAEDREWSSAIRGTEQKIKETEDLEKYKGDIAITYNQNNGKPLPSYIQTKINRASNQGEVNQILSDNGISLAKPITPKSVVPGINYTTNADGTITYATDLDAIVGTVLSTIPTKFGQETFQSQMSKARDDADRINLVAAQVLKGQPAEFKNDFRNQAVGVSMIDKAIAELDKGVKTGVIKNGVQYVYNALGKDFDPALAKIDGYITSAIQPYRNSVTGAAWGDQEEGEYQSLFGSTKYSPEELKQRLLQTKELLKSKSSEGLNAFVNPIGYYDNPFQSGDLNTTSTNNSVNYTATLDDLLKKYQK